MKLQNQHGGTAILASKVSFGLYHLSASVFCINCLSVHH